MSLWLTAFKAVLPHVGTIIDVAKPVFTKKPPPAAAPAAQDPLTQQQIAELQAAVSQNASNLATLASEVERLRRLVVYTTRALAVAIAVVGVLLVFVLLR